MRKRRLYLFVDLSPHLPMDVDELKYRRKPEVIEEYRVSLVVFFYTAARFRPLMEKY